MDKEKQATEHQEQRALARDFSFLNLIARMSNPSPQEEKHIMDIIKTFSQQDNKDAALFILGKLKQEEISVIAYKRAIRHQNWVRKNVC